LPCPQSLGDPNPLEVAKCSRHSHTSCAAARRLMRKVVPAKASTLGSMAVEVDGAVHTAHVGQHDQSHAATGRSVGASMKLEPQPGIWPSAQMAEDAFENEGSGADVQPGVLDETAGDPLEDEPLDVKLEGDDRLEGNDTDVQVHEGGAQSNQTGISRQGISPTRRPRGWSWSGSRSRATGLPRRRPATTAPWYRQRSSQGTTANIWPRSWSKAIANAGTVWNKITTGAKDLANDLKSGNLTKAMSGVKKEITEVKDLATRGVNETKSVVKEEAEKLEADSNEKLSGTIENLVNEKKKEEDKVANQGLSASQVVNDMFAKQIVTATKQSEDVSKAVETEAKVVIEAVSAEGARVAAAADAEAKAADVKKAL